MAFYVLIWNVGNFNCPEEIGECGMGMLKESRREEVQASNIHSSGIDKNVEELAKRKMEDC